jgi:16S rRNA (guanine966-N2)-methyltransferase
MRIVGGRWAERRLVSPGPRVRPTAEAVRDAWLTDLADHLPGARVLDLFAGSGALGLEALSRGAESVDLVENGSASLHALKANVAALRAGSRARVFKKDVLVFLDDTPEGAYELAFADPPYGSRVLDAVVGRWEASPFSRILSVEHDSDHVLRGGVHELDFGETRVTRFGGGPG